MISGACHDHLQESESEKLKFFTLMLMLNLKSIQTVTINITTNKWICQVYGFKFTPIGLKFKVLFFHQLGPIFMTTSPPQQC